MEEGEGMSWTNLALDDSWDGDFPDYVEVCSAGGSRRFFPELFTENASKAEGVFSCGRCGSTYSERAFSRGIDYCPRCRAKIKR